ncbi:MAG: ABC transporter ATP-binding protein [Coriobacteriales bacterium]|jgi:ABC-2 type transport system ATP-binding protein|nr:ABC transporter ATP-binding protein [Coriobacteriales bacterium]
MSNILEVRGLSKRYKAFSLNAVDFAVPKGYIMGFVGPNGAGKTTTIKLILGISRRDAGHVKLFGEEGTLEQNGRIGVVMDAPPYVDDWTANDVERAISPFYPRWNAEHYDGYLKRFGLDRKKKVKELSRGMRMKLQIAVALSHNAELLILDEPTSGLDPAARDEICDLLREFVTDENRSVLFSTHITSDLEKTADYITFILNGKIAFTGAKDVLLEKYARVTGGLRELDSGALRELIISCREHGTGFEGMIETVNVGKMPSGVFVEPISLDEIIIFMNKGVDSHAHINE